MSKTKNGDTNIRVTWATHDALLELRKVPTETIEGVLVRAISALIEKESEPNAN